MAKNVGVIGSLKGKVGNMVFRSRRGLQIASVYQPTVANPKTARQELSRAKMVLATGYLKSVLPFVRAGWQKVRPTYEMQAAMSKMLPVSSGAITGTEVDELEIVNASVAPCLSANELGILNVATPSSASGKVSVVVTPSSNMFLGPSGEPIGLGAVVAVRTVATGECVVGFSALEEGANTVEVVVPATWDGGQADVFVYAKQIPEAINGIASSTAPWKYPAACSACTYAGSVQVSF